MLAALLLAALAAGCGSKSSSSTTGETFTGTENPYTLKAKLSPAQVPGNPKGASGASGAFTGTIKPFSDSGTLEWQLNLKGLSSKATAARIYFGPPGKTGAAVIDLCTPCDAHESGFVGANSAILQPLLGRPAYVNVLTKKNPEGEIRGRTHGPQAERVRLGSYAAQNVPQRLIILVLSCAAAVTCAGCGGGGSEAGASGQTTTRAKATPTRVVSAKLTGAADVPKGSPEGSGTAQVTLDAAGSKACWKLTIAGIGRALSAHVHKAPTGEVGPVVIPLGATFAKQGCVLVSPKVIAAVGENPSGYYVNVHTRKYLNGAIRGQLEAATPG